MLRLAVVNALQKQPSDKFAPTMAGEAIFDSRLDDIEFDAEGYQELPIVQVYVDSDETEAYSPSSGEMDGYRHVLLRIIFAVGSFNTYVQEDGERRTQYGLPTTDAALEALLDIFEWQIMNALQHVNRPASTAIHKMVMAWNSFHSEPSRSADKNNRLAERTLTFRVRIAQDCPRAWRFDTDAPYRAPQGLPRFQDAPNLNALIEALAKNPENEGLIQDLAEIATGEGRIVVPRLRTGKIKIASADTTNGTPVFHVNRDLIEARFTL